VPPVEELEYQWVEEEEEDETEYTVERVLDQRWSYT